MLNAKCGPFVYDPNKADIITMNSGEKKLFFGMQLIPSRHRYGVPQDFRWDYAQNMPLTYICYFEKWRKKKEEKSGTGNDSGLLAPIINYVNAILSLPDDGYFKPDEKTSIHHSPDGGVFIERKKGPGDYGKEDCKIFLSPEEWRVLLSEVNSTI
ncbi:Uncharacterised protein [uncultured archaeon]|nr:Uncharacterised protein [uncultured archaeon]